MAGRTSLHGFDVASSRVLLCSISTVCLVPRRHLVCCAWYAIQKMPQM
jgi:hypothetical protein